MKDIKKILVVGGDKRQIYVAQNLLQNGYEAQLCFFDLPKESAGAFVEQIKYGSGAAGIKDADALLLPLPVSRDGISINAPFCENSVPINLLLELMDPSQTVFAGMMSKELKSAFFKKGIRVYDYFEREELAINNAIPTAQGVIKTAIDNIEFTLFGSSCAITGFGRTAKVLAKALKGIGANVTIAARKYSDLAWAKAEGCNTVPIERFAEACSGFDILVNTVPSIIITEQIIKKLKKDCLIIEIASSPFGIDFEAAEKYGIKALKCGSLPGKVAPKTAGAIIADSVINIIKEGSQ